MLLVGLESPAAPFSGGASVVLPPLVTSERSAVSAAVGSLEVVSEAPVGVVSESVEAEPPEIVAVGFAAAVLSGVVTGSPDVGCGSDVVGDDESVDVEPALGFAVAVEVGAAVESVASATVIGESTGVGVEVGAVPVPAAVVASSVVPTDPTSARAVVATSAALSIKQTSVATTVGRRHRPKELRLRTSTLPHTPKFLGPLHYPGIGPRTRRNLNAVRKLRTKLKSN
jgi:hypothetical protein